MTTETALVREFYDDWGRSGNPLGTLAGTRQVGDGRSGDTYIAELHAETIIGRLGSDDPHYRGDAVLTVWEKLPVRGDEVRDRLPFDDYPEVYPKTTWAWQRVFQATFGEYDEARHLYNELDPEGVEERRENERPELDA